MDERTVARLYGVTRLAIAAGVLLFPRTARLWLGPATSQREVRNAVRVLAVRDGLLGAALLLTLDHPDLRRRMAGLCAVADAGDAATSGLDRLRGGGGGTAFLAATATGGAVVGALTASGKLRRP